MSSVSKTQNKNLETRQKPNQSDNEHEIKNKVVQRPEETGN